VLETFSNQIKAFGIQIKEGSLRFPERRVVIILANREQLEQLTLLSDFIAEFRRAKTTARYWSELDNFLQAEWVEDILNRLQVESSDVSICILDTGVNNGHPLLAPVLNDQDCHAVDPAWGTADHHRHGTLMAGVSAYYDLQSVLLHQGPVRVRHLLESVKILPPTGENKEEFWGYITTQAVSRVEIPSPDRKRVHCLPVTAEKTRERGHPTSWSAAIDRLCSGAEDDTQRLMIISAGNVKDLESPYPATQLTDEVHDPAQAWNALTVGAYTELNTITDPTVSGYRPVAPANGLSPFSTTSLAWDKAWPLKPEIVMEGGNLAKDGNGFISVCDDLSVLSTHYKPHEAHFQPFQMTSASTARAAWFAAQIQAVYPDYWPETIRALVVHSTEWTDTLIHQFNIDMSKKTEIERLMKICGYGVPDLDKALYCAANSLTLVAQSELQPFEKNPKGGYRTNEMHLYDLPWPREVLLDLPSETRVQMRVSLSYFIEPGPGRIGWQDRYRYASCGLRFDINSPGVPRDEFQRKINKAARDETNGAPDVPSAAQYWKIGQARNRGSIHSDIWEGSAADLAGSGFLAVYPKIGWWKERHHLGRWDRKVRYALIVSISAPDVEVDIYTEVANQIGITVPISVEI
ncbi:MAG: S8 family peptidase, partial [bacterium]